MNDVDNSRIRYQKITLAQASVSGNAGEAR